jgi:hypothetical protein
LPKKGSHPNSLILFAVRTRVITLLESIAVGITGVVSGTETAGATRGVGATVLGIDSITALTVWAIKTGFITGIRAIAGAAFCSCDSTLSGGKSPAGIKPTPTWSLDDSSTLG